jgi:hypothetical protein
MDEEALMNACSSGCRERSANFTVQEHMPFSKCGKICLLDKDGDYIEK